jgi:hypothetical protein
MLDELLELRRKLGFKIEPCWRAYFTWLKRRFFFFAPCMPFQIGGSDHETASFRLVFPVTIDIIGTGSLVFRAAPKRRY